jgi:hypothetical protein
MIRGLLWQGVFLTGFGVLVLAGCEPGSPPQDKGGPGSPPQEVNARLAADVPVYTVYPDSAKKADVEIIARCVSLKEYGKTTKGDWVKHWYQVIFEVIEVTAGKWEDPNVVFILYDKWPTVESGIMLKKAPFPFSKGWVFVVRLDTSESKKLPLVVAHERRSVIPPHGKIRRRTWDFNDARDKKLYEQVSGAAIRFMEREGEKVGAIAVAEEHNGFFVVENRSELCSWPIIVDKDTFEARWLEPRLE